jgi:hypothetical protein
LCANWRATRIHLESYVRVGGCNMVSLRIYLYLCVGGRYQEITNDQFNLISGIQQVRWDGQMDRSEVGQKTAQMRIPRTTTTVSGQEKAHSFNSLIQNLKDQFRINRPDERVAQGVKLLSKLM